MQNKIKSLISLSILSVVTILMSCSSEKKPKYNSPLTSATDSLAYVIGMNVAENLLKMDSTINIDVVCRAISESAKGKSILSKDEAKTYYLRYLTHVIPEQKMGYEDRYLEELVKADRNFTRSESGLTYDVIVIGDEDLTPRNKTDLISIRYIIKRVDGEQIYSSYEKQDTLVSSLENISEGLQESVRKIGKGGKIYAWLPSKMAYGSEGDSELAVEPYETLYYEIELVDMEKYGARDIKSTNW